MVSMDNDIGEIKVLPEVARLDMPHDEKVALSVLVERARTDFETFVLLFNPPDHCDYVYSKLHEYLVGLVQATVDGTRRRRQSVSVPPQHGKSHVLSIEAPAWLLGRKPGIQIAITSFSLELVTDMSKAIRSRLDHEIYKLVFPDVKIVAGSDRMESWRCTNGGAIRAKPRGAKLTGRKVDYLIIDDPHEGRKEAESKTKRKEVRDWYFADCYTRLSPNAVVFIIATRWHPEDLIGTLTNKSNVKALLAIGMEREIYEVHNIPALCEDEERDPLGRKIGEPAFPEVRTKEFLQGVKAAIPDYEWASQYMGRPRAAASGQVDVSRFQYCEIEEVPWDAATIRAWDLAITEDTKNDYTAGVLIAYDPKNDFLYILDIWHGRRVWPKMRKVIPEIARADKQHENVQIMGIEAVAGFGAVAQDLRDILLGEVKVLAYHPPAGDKLTRALPWLNKVEARKVFLVRGEWNDAFTEEVTAFPDGEFDDQVDGVTIGWELLTGRNRNGGEVRGNAATRPTSTGNRPQSARPQPATS